jgi:hypothetical protein
MAGAAAPVSRTRQRVLLPADRAVVLSRKLTAPGECMTRGTNDPHSGCMPLPQEGERLEANGLNSFPAPSFQKDTDLIRFFWLSKREDDRSRP